MDPNKDKSENPERDFTFTKDVGTGEEPEKAPVRIVPAAPPEKED